MKRVGFVALGVAMMLSTLPIHAIEKSEHKVRKYLNLSAFDVTDLKDEILGERDETLGVRVDLIEPIRKMSLGDKKLEKVLFAQTRVRDLFLTSTSEDEIYNSYLYIEAGRLCLVSLGYGHSEAVDMIQQVAQRQVNNKMREMAAIRSERTLRALTLPNLDADSDYSQYCKYYGVTS